MWTKHQGASRPDLLSRGTFHTGAPAGSNDDNFLSVEKAPRTVWPVAKGLPEPHDLVDPRLSEEGIEKLYIGAPMTMVSAACSSSINSSEVERYDR